MTLPRPNEQRKVDQLLLKLAKINPVSTQPAPIASGKSALKTA